MRRCDEVTENIPAPCAWAAEHATRRKAASAEIFEYIMMNKVCVVEKLVRCGMLRESMMQERNESCSAYILPLLSMERMRTLQNRDLPIDRAGNRTHAPSQSIHVALREGPRVSCTARSGSRHGPPRRCSAHPECQRDRGSSREKPWLEYLRSCAARRTVERAMRCYVWSAHDGKRPRCSGDNRSGYAERRQTSTRAGRMQNASGHLPRVAAATYLAG